MKIAIKKYKELGKVQKGICTFIVAIMFFLFYSYIYNDILETSRMGMAFWEKLFAGKIRFFYSEMFDMFPFAYTKQVQGVYDFPIYILFAIWNFPLYLIDTFTNIEVFDSVLCLMWMKTLILVFVYLLLKAMAELSKSIGLDEEDTFIVHVLFLTSAFFMSSIIISCAYDVVSLYFAILGVSAWMKGDIRKFILFFMLAIPLKFFSLLLFIPLLLLREKRVLHVIGATVASVLPILIFRIIVPCTGNGIGIRLTDALHGTDLSNLALLYSITNFAHFAIGETYYSVIGWIVLFLICYFLKLESDEQYYRIGIYVCFMSYMVLFVTCYSHPYWLLILMPFVHIIMAQNKDILHVNTLLELLFSCAMIGAQIVVFPWCYGNAPVSGMFWRFILGRPENFEQVNIITMITKMAGSEAARKMTTGVGGMGTSIFIASIIVFAIINFPIEFGLKKYLYHKNKNVEAWLYSSRIVVSLLIGVIPLVFYVISL